jgi:hypothetical protein
MTIQNGRCMGSTTTTLTEEYLSEKYPMVELERML